MRKIICRILKKHIWKEISGAYVNNYGLAGRIVIFRCKRCGEGKKEFHGTLSMSYGDMLDSGFTFNKDTEITILAGGEEID